MQACETPPSKKNTHDSPAALGLQAAATFEYIMPLQVQILTLCVCRNPHHHVNYTYHYMQWEFCCEVVRVCGG